MSTFPQKPWSDNPNAPKISPREYSNEKANFIGIVASSILYGGSIYHVSVDSSSPLVSSIILGILVILFFRCMSALLDPVNRARGGIRWLLVTHTVVMFSIATIFIAMHFNLQSFAYVDNREFHGTEEIPPGPLEYQLFTASKGIGPARTVMVFLNNWLADGLLVSSVFGSAGRISNTRHYSALPLLCYFRHELLGHRPPLPYIPRFFGSVLEFSTN